MPKVKMTDTEEKNRNVRAVIAKNQELQSLSDKEMAVKLHCTRQTFQNKKKRPETFTLKEIRILAVVLHMSDEDKVMLL